MLDKIFPKIHPEGYKFLAIAIFVTIFLHFLSNFLVSGLISAPTLNVRPKQKIVNKYTRNNLIRLLYQKI